MIMMPFFAFDVGQDWSRIDWDWLFLLYLAGQAGIIFLLLMSPVLLLVIVWLLRREQRSDSGRFQG
jgi:hypothetical protein